ncbi:MAG: hypothetical protein ACPHID_00880 [Thermoplasmatota archaeon]
MRRLTIALAVLLGISGGVLSHNGWGGEVEAIFYSDGEGNVDVGWFAYVLAAIALASFVALLFMRQGPAAPIASLAGLASVIATCAVVSTENEWLWMYVPGALLVVLWPWPRIQKWLGVTIGVGILAMMFDHFPYASVFGVHFFLASIHMAPALAALADLGPGPSDSKPAPVSA